MSVISNRVTDKQEAFLQALIAGKSQREAYRSAYNSASAKDATVDQSACKLLKNPKVAARYEELQAKVRSTAEQCAVASSVEVLKELTNIGMGKCEYPAYDMFGNQYSRYPSVTQRTKALELLGKKYGLFTERVQLDGAALVQIVDDIPSYTQEEESG